MIRRGMLMTICLLALASAAATALAARRAPEGGKRMTSDIYVLKVTTIDGDEKPLIGANHCGAENHAALGDCSPSSDGPLYLVSPGESVPRRG